MSKALDLVKRRSVVISAPGKIAKVPGYNAANFDAIVRMPADPTEGPMVLVKETTGLQRTFLVINKYLGERTNRERGLVTPLAAFEAHRLVTDASFDEIAISLGFKEGNTSLEIDDIVAAKGDVDIVRDRLSGGTSLIYRAQSADEALQPASTAIAVAVTQSQVEEWLESNVGQVKSAPAQGQGRFSSVTETSDEEIDRLITQR